MKITIDTQQDKFEDIRQIISLLAGILEKKDGAISSTAPAESTSMMDMFSDDDTAVKRGIDTSSETPPDFGSFLNLAKSSSSSSLPEEKRNIPRVEIF